MRCIVVDTNIVVAALMTAAADSPVVRALRGMLSGEFVYLLSPALLAEYREVLLRPAIRKRHGLSDAEIDDLLEELVVGAVWREPIVSPSASDPGDDHLWALLHSQPGALLVTGDQLLCDNPPAGCSVMSARVFIETVLRVQN